MTFRSVSIYGKSTEEIRIIYVAFCGISKDKCRIRLRHLQGDCSFFFVNIYGGVFLPYERNEYNE